VQSSGRHVTSVIFVSSAGQVAPLFFYCSRQKYYAKCFDALSPEIFKKDDGSPHWLAQSGWLMGLLFAPRMTPMKKRDAFGFRSY